jgi:hypothetical protein
MSAKHGDPAAAEPRRTHRREVLIGGGLLLGGLLLPRAARPAAALPSAETAAALEKRRLVYISPLLRDGKESRCHGEVWYFLDGADVVIGTNPERWKARSVRSGSARARLWVTADDTERDYRKGTSFDARARFDADPASFDRLLSAYAAKYPDEWAKWGPRFRKSHEDGTRVLIRYTPE